MSNETVIGILNRSADEVCAFLKLDKKTFLESVRNSIFQENLSGHNYHVCLVDFRGKEGNSLGSVCIKYSSDEKMQPGLAVEVKALGLLYLNKKICPMIVDTGVLEQEGTTYIVMETIRGNPVQSTELHIENMEVIFDLIQFHESILLKNAQDLGALSHIEDFHQETDFEKKIHMLLAKHVPDLTLEDSLNFLNPYLNDRRVIQKRTLVTDRSVENIFQNKNGKIVLIDFSTIRVGTQFDNWIQCIDDPRACFSCKKEELIELFFERNGLNKKDIGLFYAASVYTNLLQGIFTYKKNSKLGMSYFKNATESCRRLRNEEAC